jgi:hypothetical protein
MDLREQHDQASGLAARSKGDAQNTRPVPADGKNRTALACQFRACPGSGRSVNAPTWRGLMAVKRRWPSVAIPVSPVTPGNGRHGGIDDAKRKIKIRFHESGDAADAGALESGLNPSPPNDRKKVTSARGPARDWRRRPIPPEAGEGTSSGPFAYSATRLPVSAGQAAQDPQRLG